MLDYLTGTFDWGEAIPAGQLALETTGARMECALILMEDIKAKLPAYLDALPARA